MTTPRRGVLIGAGVVAALVAVVAILFALDDGDGFGLVTADPARRSYLAVFLLILGDAVIPIFPGETTLNAASTLAAQETLSLPLVIVAGRPARSSETRCSSGSRAGTPTASAPSSSARMREWPRPWSSWVRTTRSC